MKRFFYWLTGGRPMQLHIKNVFRDVVNGQMVHVYTDHKGRDWMAHGRWSLFRVAMSESWKHGRSGHERG